MINKKIVVTLFLLLIVITAGCLSEDNGSTASTSGDDAESLVATGGQNEDEQGMAGNYIPKYNPDGASVQEVAIANLPKTIPFTNGLVIRDLKVDDDYFYGNIKNTAGLKRSLSTVSFTYLDSNGIHTRYASTIEIRGYNDATKKDRWVGAIDISPGQDFYFRVATMKKYDTENEIKFVKIRQ